MLITHKLGAIQEKSQMAVDFMALMVILVIEDQISVEVCS